MEIKELKKQIHSSVEELEDEEVLQNLLRILKMEIPVADTDLAYEQTVKFQKHIEKALLEARNGDTISHEEGMKNIRERWLTK